ncbi:MAG TPA: iron-sulfur cluster co-chaperone HscB C-terminal domain-containing protein [Myxococcota bacterium]|jgi:molecular chaperone HscB
MVTTPCWSCAAFVPEGAVFCPNCNAVVPPGRASPFQRLGVDAVYDLDDKALERAWLDRSRKVHPDRFARKSDVERRYAAEQTAALNDARRAIADPFDRALWLVTSAGVDASQLDQRLLMALMEARERAEESADDKAAVVADSTARFRALEVTLAEQMRARDFSKAARALAEMKTLARLVDDLGGARLIKTLSER